MDQAVGSDTAITAELSYAIDTGEKPVNETFGPGNIRRRTTGASERRAVEIRNGRPLAGRFSLDENGFEFVRHATRVADFFDADQLKTVYYPEVEQLIKDVSGAARVVVFDHTLRSGDEAEREARLVREPVLSVPMRLPRIRLPCAPAPSRSTPTYIFPLKTLLSAGSVPPMRLNEEPA